jgi:hypothetical protein
MRFQTSAINKTGASSAQKALLAPERRDKRSVLAAGCDHCDGFFDMMQRGLHHTCFSEANVMLVF